MTDLARKGQSPFYPSQPVPPEFFVGRQEQVDKIMTRGVGQVAAGKPVAVFIEGEYGIGKSSLANYLQRRAYNEKGLYPIHVALRGVKTVQDVALRVMEACVNAKTNNGNEVSSIKNWIAKYIGKQEFGGISLNLDQLKVDNPSISDPFKTIDFLYEYFNMLKSGNSKVNGLFVVIDEINGIAAEQDFSHFVKALVDDNAIKTEPLPLLLMLCGTEDRRSAMVKAYEPVSRIFDVVPIASLNDIEMKTLFLRALNSVNLGVEAKAIDTMCEFSAGLPKIVHTIGDEVFWANTDDVIDLDDAVKGVLEAKEQIGRKYVEPNVMSTIRSGDYYSILEKLSKKIGLEPSFMKSDISVELTESEKRKFNNFLQKMKGLDVIRSGDRQGEYVFNIKMVQVYFWLRYGSKQ